MNKQLYLKGDFIISNYSFYPSLIINNYNNEFLITIHEFCGDYKLINEDKIIGKINLNPLEKIILLSSYFEDFYKLHSDIYQEIILEILYSKF